MEWSTRNKYNSFNSDKGLTYYENYKKILKWLDGAEYLPPPIEVNLDPIAECNLSCYFCITQRYLRTHREEVGEMRKLPLDYMYKLVDFLANWGVEGLCISGGGEPSLHDGIWPIIMQALAKGMKVAFVTNGTKLPPELLFCQWVALSVDAGTRETYLKIKGADRFDEVIQNITKLTALQRDWEDTYTKLCFKFLIVPENQYEIYDACKLAKELGVQDFHARPVDFERKDIAEAKPLRMDIESIHKQFAQCHELETDKFRVFTVTHKFDPEFHVKYDYESCLAAPLILPILTDGNAYLCVEHKMDSKYKLGSCYPDPRKILKWWGSDKHRQMIKGILPERDCSRCIYCEYNNQIEAVKEDTMCRSFP